MGQYGEAVTGPKWQYLPAGTVVYMHWFVGQGCWPRCKFCGCAIKAMTSARPGGLAWIWNGLGSLICHGAQTGDTPIIDLDVRRFRRWLERIPR